MRSVFVPRATDMPGAPRRRTPRLRRERVASRRSSRNRTVRKDVSGTTVDLLIRGGTIVNGDGSRRSDVAIRDGVVVAIDDFESIEATETVDASGMLVLPGIVDEHVHPVYLDDPAYIS